MKSNSGVVVGLVMAGALFIGCESEPEAKPKLEAMSKEEQEESIAAIKEIAGSKIMLTPKFTVVLSGTKITDAGLAHLGGMTGLEYLHLNGTPITDAGVAHLEGMTGLRGLILNDTKVTDAGQEHLKDMTKLEMLHLNETQVTDAGMEHLKGLTGLQVLYLSGTEVSKAGRAKLQAALPKCQIIK